MFTKLTLVYCRHVFIYISSLFILSLVNKFPSKPNFLFIFLSRLNFARLMAATVFHFSTMASSTTGIVQDIVRIKDVFSSRITFKVPLDYNDPSKGLITVAGALTQKYRKSLNELEVGSHVTEKTQLILKDTKVVLYLQGGPGFPCQIPASGEAISKLLLDRGYLVFYLDQRGTGYSTPIDAADLTAFKSVEEAGSYILNFRADSIVHDCELIRKLLGLTKWSLLGQSYGGFCTFTYLSLYPGSIAEALVTGGIPPINRGPDDVYRATYSRTAERNRHYYQKYPQDVVRVRRIAKYLSENRVVFPDGGIFSVERLQTLGLSFGGSGGTDEIHRLISKLAWDLELRGSFTYSVLQEVQNSYSFDTNPIYFLFQEAIYQDSYPRSTFWSADRLRYLLENSAFVYDASHPESQPLYFTGEMVYKSMVDDYLQLRPVKDLANWLHSNTDWSKLYDTEVLAGLTWDKVKIVAATYVYDQYVDFDVSMQVKKEVFKGNGNLKQYVTSEFFHNGLRADPVKVLGSLLDLLSDEVD